MEKTIHYCDVCEKETELDELYTIRMAVKEKHDRERITNGSFDVCKECLSETGVLFNQFGSINCNRSMEQSHSVWLRWLKRFLGR